MTAWLKPVSPLSITDIALDTLDYADDAKHDFEGDLVSLVPYLHKPPQALLVTRNSRSVARIGRKTVMVRASEEFLEECMKIEAVIESRFK